MVVLSVICSCTLTGPGGLLGNKSPHEEYKERLTISRLNETVMGRQWMEASGQSLMKAVRIQLPYRETGYFSANEVSAFAFSFNARRGEKISITLTTIPKTNFNVFADLFLFESKKTDPFRLVASAESKDSTFTYDVEDDDTFLIRIQPELICQGEYTLTIRTGPSLAFPVKGKTNIGSLYGDPRDRGARRHDGIDIFAPRHAPAVAAANGVIMQVNENALGGKVVWLNAAGKNFTLYYAHLDSQLVHPGQIVKAGDTIGLVGNTGNARTTSPHLHFGIYSGGGTYDPLPFVKAATKEVPAVTVSTDKLNKWVRVKSGNQKLYSEATTGSAAVRTLPESTLLKAQAATQNNYKVLLPDGTLGYIPGKVIADAETPLKKISIHNQQPLFDQPDTMAARKRVLTANSTLNLLGTFNQYNFVRDDDGHIGWIPK